MKAPTTAPRFPKIESPFDREDQDGDYVVFDSWNVDPNWFKRRTIAVEKLDGTNCAVWLENQQVEDVFSRMGDKSMNYVHPYPSDTNHQRIVAGVRNAINAGYFDGLGDGYHYGELIGPMVQGNPHEVDEHLFVPFGWAQNHLRYKSWGEYGQDFEDLSDWFKDGLFSLFYAHYHGVDLDTASVSNGTFCEGVMFTDSYHVNNTVLGYSWDDAPSANNFAKLRRDMFKWYEGERH